jgi:plasmid rolling circle replication initiator protein Rep
MQSGLRMPREFSVLCPNCGWRREYHPADLHDARPEAELLREFPRIQFGKKNVKKIETDDIFIQPETRLNQLVSWLLQ